LIFQFYVISLLSAIVEQILIVYTTLQLVYMLF